MGHLAADLLPLATAGAVAAFAALTLVAVGVCRRSGGPAHWVAAAFGAITVTLLLNWVPDVAGIETSGWWDDLWVVPLLLFPYLLLRFSASFGRLPAWVEIAAAGASAVVAVATLAAFTMPGALAEGSTWVDPYTLLALVYWIGVSLVTVVGLWRAGGGQPTSARRRMRLMSAATAVLAVALLATALTASGELAAIRSLVQALVQLIAVVSAAAFALGFRPPHALVLSWRQTEEEDLREGMMAVLRASTVQEVARELLPPTTRVVGGAGAAIVGADGRVAATFGEAPPQGAHVAHCEADGRDRERVALGHGRGELVVWTSRYTPFFAQEEVELLRSMGAVASLALDRCELLDDERSQRVALERAREEAERAREEALRADAAKSEFLSRMSHELRTPLNAILGFGQLLELADLGREDQAGVQHIIKAGRHLLALINDVLDLSRVEAGMLTVSLEPVQTSDLVDDAVSLIQPLASSRSIRLLQPPGSCDEYVLTDRQRCRQVLLNLLSNAVKYNHDGGEVEVTCRTVADGVLRIAVRDTGPGIDASRRGQLFEPFERLGAETSGVEGTGLGLALTKQLVERLGGSIGVDTALGSGSTFWIDLPTTHRPLDRGIPVPAPALVPTDADRTLLLVEDNLANLRVVEAMLRQRPGLSVLPAMQGRLAIELAHEHQPDVIVLDLHLPDVNGREVLNRLQADPRTRAIPVVVASADATPGRLRQLREEGAFAYVTKPLDLHEFLDVVDAALAHVDAARARADRAASAQGVSAQRR